MLYLVHRVTISIKLRPVKLDQAVSESLPHKGLYTELLGVQLTCLDPVPASIRARNAQEINITNCDVTTWSWVNLVHPHVRSSHVRTQNSHANSASGPLAVKRRLECVWVSIHVFYAKQSANSLRASALCAGGGNSSLPHPPPCWAQPFFKS